MDFITMLKTSQRDLEMNNSQFAKYIGRHRSWLCDLYANKPIGEKHILNNGTIGLLHNKLNIEYEVMDEFNREIMANQKGI